MKTGESKKSFYPVIILKLLPMPLQYVQNDSGQTTAVLIPIDEWKAITQKLADLAILDKPAVKNKKASDFKGILSPELAEDLQQHVQQSREQWQ